MPMSIIPISFPPDLWTLFYSKHGKESRRRIRDLVSMDLELYSPELEQENQYNINQIEELKKQFEEKQKQLMKDSSQLKILHLTLKDLEKRFQEDKVKDENKRKEEREEYLHKVRDLENTFQKTKWDNNHKVRTL